MSQDRLAYGLVIFLNMPNRKAPKDFSFRAEFYYINIRDNINTAIIVAIPCSKVATVWVL